jgi:hypothetical protein
MRRQRLPVCYLAILALLLGFLSLLAPSATLAAEGVAAVSPPLIVVNQPTEVTVTIPITDTRLISTSVNLQQVDATGKVLAVLGALTDAGTNGDAVAGDKTFTIRKTFTESTTDPIRLQVSWALRGVLKRVVSNVVAVEVAAIQPDAYGVLGPEGGVIAVEDPTSPLQGTQLYIPPGALDRPNLVAIKLGSHQSLGFDHLSNAGFSPVTPVVELSPSGAAFLQPVILTLRYDSTSLPAGSDPRSLSLVRLSDNVEEMEDVEPIHIDLDQHQVSGALAHFSSFALAIRDLLLVYPYKWDVDVLKYYIGPDPYGYAWGKSGTIDARSRVKTAIESWVPFQGRFTMQEVGSQSEANIAVLAAPSIVGGSARTNVCALCPATYRETDQIVIQVESSSITYDNYFSGDWPGSLEKKVVRHEVGHALGLKHNPWSSSAQAPIGVPAMWVAGVFDDPWKELERSITGDDIAALQIHYPPPPTLASLTPNTAPASTTPSVTLTGTNFTAAGAGITTVSVGGTAAMGITVVNATTITATFPAKTAGTYDVTVANTLGSFTLTNGFRYGNPPTLTSLSPNTAPAGSTPTVTVTGTNFIAAGAGTTIITVGGVAGTGMTVVSNTVLTATLPALPAGTYTVVLTNINGSATLVNGFTYTLPGGACAGVTPAPPALTVPGVASSGADYTVTWTAPTCATKYLLQESPNANFSSSTNTYTSDTSHTTSHEVTAPTTYYYRIAAENENGGVSDRSAA